jgi:hypothetical protein
MTDDERTRGFTDEQRALRTKWVTLTRQAYTLAEEATNAASRAECLSKLNRAIVLLGSAEAIVRRGKDIEED